MRLELVVWRDAWFSRDADSPAFEDYLMETVGWTDVEGRWLVVRSERDLTGTGFRAVTHIPLENVIKRKKVK